MRSLSFNQSPTSQDTTRQVFHSQITKDYLQQKNDKLLQYLDDLVKESNPKQQYKKIIENRQKERKQLEDENRRLIFKNKQLEDELARAKEEIRRQKNGEVQSQQHRNQQMNIESPPSSTSKSNSSQGPLDTLAIVPENQRLKLQTINQLHQDAQQLVQQQQSAIQKSLFLLQRAFQQLQRIVDLQKCDMRVSKLDEDSKETVIVNREKYELLIDCYVYGVVGRVNVNNQSEEMMGEGEQETKQIPIVQQFKENERDSQPPKSISKLPVLTTTTQLEKLFAQLAMKQGLRQQWQAYLQTRNTEAEQFKHTVDTIAKGSPQTKSALQKNIKHINDTTISYRTNQLEQSTALSIIQNCQTQIEQQLFNKLHEILSLSQFTQNERELFNRFDQKRKCGKLFNVEEFIQKFKSKQDLVEVSKEYTNYMIKTVNLLVMKIMEILTEHSSENPQQQFPWLANKLNAKSTELRTHLQQTLQRQCTAYLQQKHPPATHDPLQQRKIIEPIMTPPFDSQKELQRQLIQMVVQYRDVLQSCVVNSNRRTVVQLK